jgi:uncharacterized protein (DUF488 family)
VDVRSFPSSRTFPQWNQDAIQSALPADVSYRWIRDLGGRRHTPASVPSPNGGWRVKAFQAYADYMDTDQFRSGLDELLEVASGSTPAIMCSEAVPWRCHRRLITDALLVAGAKVSHIMSATMLGGQPDDVGCDHGEGAALRRRCDRRQGEHG